MRLLILVALVAGLLSWGSSHKKYVVRDPIFHDQENYIIFDSEKGKEGYLMKDPIFEDEDNWVLFREPKK